MKVERMSPSPLAVAEKQREVKKDSSCLSEKTEGTYLGWYTWLAHLCILHTQAEQIFSR